jgi:4-carboxymuconolactone decarboxylase
MEALSMRPFALAVAMVAFSAGDTSAQQGKAQGNDNHVEIEIMRDGSQSASTGSANNFTGSVRIGSRFQRGAPARVGGGVVTFEPGARTAWHTHPLGQTLIVLSGVGLVQQEGGAIETMRAGDVVWIPPNTKHWHGASPTTGMAHIAIAESLDGKAVDWLEKVTDEQYEGKEQTGAAVTR